MAGYICEYVELPLYKWGSSSDQTGALPGLVCSKIEEPLPGSNLRTWLSWSKIAQLIEELP